MSTSPILIADDYVSDSELVPVAVSARDERAQAPRTSPLGPSSPQSNADVTPERLIPTEPSSPVTPPAQISVVLIPKAPDAPGRPIRPMRAPKTRYYTTNSLIASLKEDRSPDLTQGPPRPEDAPRMLEDAVKKLDEMVERVEKEERQPLTHTMRLKMLHRPRVDRLFSRTASGTLSAKPQLATLAEEAPNQEQYLLSLPRLEREDPEV